MADKKTKNNKIDNTFDLDDDLGFSEFNFDEPKIKDDRKPIIRAALGAAKGAAKAPRDTAFLKRTLKHALPPGYGQSWDTIDKVSDSLRSLYDESAKEIKPAIRESKRVLAKLVPKDSKLVPKSVSKMISKWEADEKAQQAGQAPGPQQTRINEVKASLEMFRLQEERIAQRTAEEDGKDRLKEGIELSRHRDLTNLMMRSTISLDKIQKYQSTVTLGYQKKSLELQHLQLFALQDILTFTKEQTAKRDAILLAIAKNTTLPDSVKINSKEAREAMSRNKINESIHKGLFGGRDQIIENALAGFSGYVLGHARNAAGGLTQAAQGAEMGSDMASGLPMDKASTGGQLAGEALMKGLLGAMSGKAKKGLASGKLDRFGGQRILKGGHWLENMGANTNQRINQFRKSDKWLYEDGPGASLMRFLQGVTPRMTPDMQIKVDGAKDMDTPSTITKRTNKSINEVIPGYLARILRELQVTRTKNPNIQLTQYSYGASKFTSQGKAEAQVFKDIIDGKAAKRTNQQLDQLLKELDPEDKLSAPAKKELKKKLLTNSANVNEASSDNLARYSSYSGVKDELVAEIVPVMQSFFSKLSPENRTAFSRANNSLATSIADPRAAIQREANFGNVAYLKRMGFVDAQGKNVDMSKIIEYVLDPANSQEVGKMAAGDGPTKSAGGSAFQSMSRNLSPKATMSERVTSASEAAKAAMGGAAQSAMGGINTLRSMSGQDMVNSAKDVATALDFKARLKIHDLYVAGETSPRLLATKMQMGAYRDIATKKIITSIDQIKGPVEDTLANNSVVVEAKDLLRLTYKNASNTFVKAETSVREGAAEGFGLGNIPRNAGDLTNALKVKGAELMGAAKEEAADVYVEGEDAPRMLAAKMTQGKYTDKETGNPVTHQTEINGAVVDEDNKTVVEPNEIPKLRVWDPRKGGLAPIRFLGSIALKIAKGLWWVQKKNTQWAMWNVKQLWRATKGSVNLVKKIFAKRPKDVYVKGEPQPRLYAARFAAGDYRDQESGERIYFHDEIRGPVIDRDDQVVLDAADADKLQVYDNILKVMNPLRLVSWLGKKFGQGVWWFAKKWQTKWAPAASKAMLKGIGTVTGAIANWLSKPGDVYIKGETVARLGAGAMRAGKYFLASTRKVITKLADITGPVVDENGETVISHDEWTRGLVNKDGTPLQGGGFSKALGTITKLMSVRVKLPIAERGKSTEALLKDKVVSAGDKTVILLQDIKDMVKEKLNPKKVLGDTDGDGVRDGSFMDQLRKKKEDENKPKDAAKDKDDAKKTGLLSGLASLIFGKKKKAEDEEGGGSSLLGDAATGAGAAAGGAAATKTLGGRILGGLKGGAKFLGRGAVKIGAGAMALRAAGGYAADGVAGKLGAGGNNLDTEQDNANWENMTALEKLESGAGRGIEKIGSMFFLDNMANSAAKKRIDAETSYMQNKKAENTPGKGLLDYLMMASPMGIGMGLGSLFGPGAGAKDSAYDDIRYVQYGFEPKNKDAREKASAMEDYLQGLVKDGTMVSIDEANMDVKKVAGIWGYDVKDQKQLETFFGWYKNRFKPVFLTHLSAIKRFTGKADLRNVGSIKKEDQASYIDAIRMDGGPYDYTNLPSPSNAWVPTSKNAVMAAVDKALKDLGATKQKVDGAKVAGAQAAAATAVAAAASGKQPGDTPAAASFTAAGLMGSLVKLPSLVIDKIASVSNFISGKKNIDVLEAVRFKTYGLTEMLNYRALGLNALESEVFKTVKFQGDNQAVWNGNPLEVLQAVQPGFSIADVIGERAHMWLTWFDTRFLPVFLSFLSSYKALTGKDDYQNASTTLKLDQQLQVARVISSISGVWQQTASPWGQDVKVGTDAKIVEENIAFLEKAAKAVTLLDPKAPVDTAKSSTTSGTESLWQKTKNTVSNFFSPSSTNVTPLAAPTSPDAEAPSKAAVGVSPVAVATGGGNGMPPAAGGELSDGRNALSHLALKNGVKLEGMHPTFMKNFNGMAEEYGKLTGKKIGINDAFRSYEDQMAAKAKYGPRAAAPGSSLHEFGLAMDINEATLDEMDKMGLMRKYGFTRPVGGEGWHMEPIGIQQDIAKFKKDKAAADAAISSGVGRGGGGFGTVKGAPKYTRNQALAMSIYSSSGAPTVDNDKKTDPAAPGAVGAVVNGQPVASGVAAPSSSVPAPGTGGQIGGAGTPGAAADGEAKGASASPGGAASAVLTGNSTPQSPATMPADPSVKVPDPKGGGYSGLKDTIEGAAKMVGVDPDSMTRMAAIESGFNASAQSKSSSAGGLFQFTDDTWKAMLDKYGRKYGYDARTPKTDAKASAIMAAHMLKDAAKYVGGKIKRPFGPTEAYMTHFLGMGGATQFLQAMEANPQAIAAQAMPKAANANKDIFYDGARPRTFAEVYAVLNNKVNTKLASFGVPNVAKSNDALAAAASTPSGSSSDGSEPSGAPVAATAPQSSAPTAAAAPSAPTAPAGQGPLSDALGFKPTQAVQPLAPKGQPEQMNASIFAKTEDLLGQSLDVQKKSLEVLQAIFGVLGKTAGADSSAATPPANNPKKDDFQVPKGRVDMARRMT